MEVGLSLGSNLGDRMNHLRNARQRILAAAGVSLLTQSPVYETEPVDVPKEFSSILFLNGILIIQTLVSIPQLLTTFQFIEQQLGRVPEATRNTPRPIDIDIIYADNFQMKLSHVTIPHPRWAERRFVLQPLCDVRPDLQLPSHTGTVSEVLAGLRNGGKVTLLSKSW